MNIESNQEQFIEEMNSLKSSLITAISSANVEKYREEYKGKFSSERFKKHFVEKIALHTTFKYILIRMVEEKMQRVKVKLNSDGLKNWYEMSKNFRTDYNELFNFALKDVKREADLAVIFENTVYDEKTFIDYKERVMNKHIPILAKYDFATLNENSTLTLIDHLYDSEKRDELQDFHQSSLIINFLLQQVGLI